MILFFGGLFLLFKSTMEIHHKIEGTPEEIKANSTSSLKGVILQIVFLDIIFSFDSIQTAVGLVKGVSIMIIAVVISILIMMAFAGENCTLEAIATYWFFGESTKGMVVEISK